MEYWGGAKGILAPPLKLLGGEAWPPWHPLFLRLCVRLSDNILTPKSGHLSQAFDAWKIVQLSDSSKTPKLSLSHVVGALKTVQWAII